MTDYLALNRHISACFQFNGSRFNKLPTKWPLHKELKEGLTVLVCTRQRCQSMERFLESLSSSTLMPDELIIVDASHDDSTEIVVRRIVKKNMVALRTKYIRVSEVFRGLTRQRNFGIKLVETDLTVFFDDDIVLRPDALTVLNKTLRDSPNLIAVTCHLENAIFKTLPNIWKLRKWLGFWSISDIGFLSQAGTAIPQNLLPKFEGTRQVDIVQGGATCWRTWVLRSVPFDESFIGYGQAEDLEYSLRTIPLGLKVIAGEARVLHLHDQAGRLSPYQYGQQSGRGFAVIFRRYGYKTPGAVIGFICWQLLDVLILMASGLRHPGNCLQAIGRCVGLLGQLRGND